MTSKSIYIQAVAGAGKTTHLMEESKKYERVLLLTYTNAMHIEHKMKVSENVETYTIYNFLFNLCLRPYTSEFDGIWFSNSTIKKKRVK